MTISVKNYLKSLEFSRIFMFSTKNEKSCKIFAKILKKVNALKNMKIKIVVTLMCVKYLSRKRMKVNLMKL